MSELWSVLERLAAKIESRKGADPAKSYSARLIADPKLAGKKLGEEAIETIQAAAFGYRDDIAAESADLLYHWLALMAATDTPLEAVAEKLLAREGVSGLAEKAARQP